MASDPHPTKKRRQSMCVGCGGQIQDQYILRVAPDLEWHARCLKCADCNQYLDESCTCFVRDGKTYCKRDYLRLFGQKCTKCFIGFSKSDFVMRARNKTFHIDCFRCVACSRQLIPGDEFALREDGLFCKADHEVVERAGSQENSNGSPVNNNNNGENKSTGQGLQLAGRAEQISDRERDRPREKTRKEQKTTRVRTVLNEKQLHTLRTCYNANPRPDALMKEQLVEMTSLSPRVIRVWFQNKRCKDKKRSIYLKQMQEQQEKNWYPKYPGVLDLSPNSQDLQNGNRPPLQGGVPMVASSPVRHDSTMQGNTVEVQSYQPPWKALSDFAMQSEIDQPPFQQLVNNFDQDSNHIHGGYDGHHDAGHHGFSLQDSCNNGYDGNGMYNPMLDLNTSNDSFTVMDVPGSVHSSELSSPISQ